MSAAGDEAPPGAAGPPRAKATWINLLVDFGPLLLWFVSYRLFRPPSDAGIGQIVAVTKSTMVFMAATLVALVVSKWRLGRVSPMLWLSSLLILGFGSLTIWLNDRFYIQIKPTVIYLFFAAVLFGGLLRGKPMLKVLLHSALDGLSERGWLLLSRNWAWFFVALALLNEVARRVLSFDGWLQAKLYGFTALSFAFTLTQLRLMLRHGLGSAEAGEAEAPPPAQG